MIRSEAQKKIERLNAAIGLENQNPWTKESHDRHCRLIEKRDALQFDVYDGRFPEREYKCADCARGEIDNIADFYVTGYDYIDQRPFREYVCQNHLTAWEDDGERKVNKIREV